MKAETQIKYVVAQISPLAEWFVRYHPGSAHRLHLRRADWQLVRAHPDLARAHGFRVEGEEVTFKGFQVQPTDCGARHNPSYLDTPR